MLGDADRSFVCGEVDSRQGRPGEGNGSTVLLELVHSLLHDLARWIN